MLDNMRSLDRSNPLSLKHQFPKAWSLRSMTLSSLHSTSAPWKTRLLVSSPSALSYRVYMTFIWGTLRSSRSTYIQSSIKEKITDVRMKMQSLSLWSCEAYRVKGISITILRKSPFRTVDFNSVGPTFVDHWVRFTWHIWIINRTSCYNRCI